VTGIPLTGGMWAKLAVFGSAMRAGSFGLTLALIGIATSVVAAYYYLNVVRQMFVVPAAEVGPARLQVPVAVTFALGLAAAATLLIGIFPQPLMSLATLSASMMGALLY
jgi:NADH-quinone oxidoreductase subunit N